MEKKQEISNNSNRGRGIPDELLREILRLLPARSICRFRCVSKYWCDLLQCPIFMYDDIETRPPLEIEIQQNHLLQYFTIDGSPVKEGRNHYMVPSEEVVGGNKVISNYRRCNSFICCLYDSDKLLLSHLSNNNSYYSLPPPPLPAGFNFEFGFDPHSKLYKVLVWTDGSTMSDFYLLTLTTSSNKTFSNSHWRRPLGGVPLWSKSSSFEKSLVTTKGMIYLFDGTEFISFNLSTEEFEMIELPAVLHNEFDIIEHPNLVPDEFDDNEFQDPGMVYQDGMFSESEFPPCDYEEYQTARMVQSDFSYLLFEYDQCLCWVEQSSFTSDVGLQHWAISGMYMLKEHVDDEYNMWIPLIEKATLPPIHGYGLPNSPIWSQKHSNFSSTRNGQVIITASDSATQSVIVIFYNFLDHQFGSIHRHLPISTISNASSRELF